MTDSCGHSKSGHGSLNFFFFFLLLEGLLGLSSPAIISSGSSQDLSTSANHIRTEESIIKQVMWKECKGVTTSSHCLKLALLRLVSAAGPGSLPLLPGLTLVWQKPQLKVEAEELEDPERVDSVLLNGLGQTLSNVSLSMSVIDSQGAFAFAGAALGGDISANSIETGRKRNRYGGALTAAGLMGGGTMLAVGMAALAAMAGKALMASLLALMLAGISALRGSGDSGDSKTTYEIVAKPVVTHHQTHSSEVVHGGGHHYKRSLPDPQILAYAMQLPTAK